MRKYPPIVFCGQCGRPAIEGLGPHDDDWVHYAPVAGDEHEVTPVTTPRASRDSRQRRVTALRRLFARQSSTL